MNNSYLVNFCHQPWNSSVFSLPQVTSLTSWGPHQADAYLPPDTGGATQTREGCLLVTGQMTEVDKGTSGGIDGEAKVTGRGRQSGFWTLLGAVLGLQCS